MYVHNRRKDVVYAYLYSFFLVIKPAHETKKAGSTEHACMWLPQLHSTAIEIGHHRTCSSRFHLQDNEPRRTHLLMKEHTHIHKKKLSVICHVMSVRVLCNESIHITLERGHNSSRTASARINSVLYPHVERCRGVRYNTQLSSISRRFRSFFTRAS